VGKRGVIKGRKNEENGGKGNVVTKGGHESHPGGVESIYSEVNGLW